MASGSEAKDTAASASSSGGAGLVSTVMSTATQVASAARDKATAMVGQASAATTQVASAATQVASAARDQATAMVETVKDKASATTAAATQVASAARDKATAMVEQATATTTQVASAARDKAMAMVGQASAAASSAVSDIVGGVKNLTVAVTTRVANFSRHASDDAKKAADESYQWLLQHLTHPDSIASAVNPPAFDITAGSGDGKEASDDHPGSHEVSLLCAFSGHLSAETTLKDKVPGRIGVWYWRGKIGIFTPATHDANATLTDNPNAQRIAQIACGCLGQNKWNGLFEGEVSVYLMPGVGDVSTSPDVVATVSAPLTAQYVRSGFAMKGHGGHFMWRTKAPTAPAAAAGAAPASASAGAAGASASGPAAAGAAGSATTTATTTPPATIHPETTIPSVYVLQSYSHSLPTILRPAISYIRKNFYGDAQTQAQAQALAAQAEAQAKVQTPTGETK